MSHLGQSNMPRVILSEEVNVGDRLVVTAVDVTNRVVWVSPDRAPRIEMVPKKEMDTALEVLRELRFGAGGPQ